MAFTKVLIANRGEIACRIMATAHDLGYRTVAIYSEADSGAPHVQMADQAVCIGPAPVAESYLNVAAILDAAARTGADAVHPGYGFLAENADFAKSCADAGLTFIGPSPQAIELMGNKRLAKLRMEEAEVPCVPGYSGADQDADVLAAAGERIGFPLMVKAASGGGGRGMRLVAEAADLPAAISGARSEAENAFGSGELILEKAVIEPRHVEIQVFADSKGNCLHLGERDCSIQRRHQKVVEEAPSPAVDEDLRAAMGAAAVAAAQAIDYQGAGTVEFLLGADGSFYFLEMNTRLQVEHPVTEMITGLDLVAWQLDVAAGAALPLTQDQIEFTGHAIEVRLYAEDPYADFLPQTGTVVAWRPSPEVRVDTGIVEGQEISPFYDPMVAKVIAHGRNREEARRRLLRGLEDTALLGLPNNRGFLLDVLRHDGFADGSATTAFIGQHFPDLQRPAPDAVARALAAVLLYRHSAHDQSGWRSAAPIVVGIDLRFDEEQCLCQVALTADGYKVTLGEDGAEDESVELELLGLDHGRVRFSSGGVVDSAGFAFDGNDLHLDLAGAANHFFEFTPELAAARQKEGDGRLIAPMAGRIVAVRAATGETVVKGQILVILEAMKMEHEIKAPSDGIVEEIGVAEGDQVDARQMLAVVAAASAEAAE
ncbi:MAG: acetyl-CoA carboxylase biotin carboxylase subunit [Rhodospirillaceae bacterium]|nr:acetyl-CoA carboxylase biotin carboxylase subunit [Rhodospirillaceae bacterium]